MQGLRLCNLSNAHKIRKMLELLCVPVLQVYDIHARRHLGAQSV